MTQIMVMDAEQFNALVRAVQDLREAVEAQDTNPWTSRSEFCKKERISPDTLRRRVKSGQYEMRGWHKGAQFRYAK